MPTRLPPAYRALLPPNLPALLPATRQEVRAWLLRQAEMRADYPAGSRLPEAAFPYQPLPPSARLTYELVDWLNFGAYLPLFSADPSPFVDARFKSRAALESYVATLLLAQRYSWKHGAADWLVRRRADGQPLGVLHLYDLSREVIGDWIPHCAVGYALAAPFRRQGYGTEALRYLLTQAAALFGRTEARALSAADNLASRALLGTCGFAVLEERPANRYRAAITLWQRELGQAN